MLRINWLFIAIVIEEKLIVLVKYRLAKDQNQ